MSTTRLPQATRLCVRRRRTWRIVVAGGGVFIQHAAHHLPKSFNTLRQHVLFLPREADSDMVAKSCAWMLALAGHLKNLALCYHDILLFFRTLCKDGALQRRRQTHPNEVTANHLAVCRGYTDTERDQMSGDGFDDPAIATTVSRLECVIHVTLQLSRLDDLSHKAGGQLAWAAARPAATSVYISVLQASRDAQKTEARVGGWIWSG